MDMIKDANPSDRTDFLNMPSKQTVELRSPDGSDNLYVNYNIFKDQGKDKKKVLESLPASCWESAESLVSQREYFEKDGVFPAGVIDNVVSKLKAFDDKGLSEKLYNKNEEISRLVRQYLHCS